MFPLARFRVDDHSMEPALRSGDYVLVSRWAYRKRPPIAGDVVVLRNPEAPGQFLVKRVMSGDALAGFFVLGDNMTHSRDSRQFGMVPRHLIVGKVRLRARA
ncbi:MAG TPA: nickel-type superoxide dismutase maturation protease [Thermoplasmata archaeon]|nr:nickel-type superoxide dismutase maturation protease [Thermoplasmata archaeon]